MYCQVKIVMLLPCTQFHAAQKSRMKTDFSSCGIPAKDSRKMPVSGAYGIICGTEYSVFSSYTGFGTGVVMGSEYSEKVCTGIVYVVGGYISSGMVQVVITTSGCRFSEF